MAWKDISTSYYDNKITFTHSALASIKTYPLYLRAQYDDASATPTSIKIRFVFIKTGTNGPSDTYYILVNPNSSTYGSLYGLKTTYGQTPSSWPYYSSAITLYKAYNASGFTIPNCWVCCNGNNAVSVSSTNFYDAYKDGGSRGASLRFDVINDTIPIMTSSTVASAIGSTTVSITDNYNNTFTLTASKASSGTNNPAGSLSNLKWGYTSDYEKGAFESGDTVTLSRDGDANTRTVYATATTSATYGSNSVATKNVGINQYYAPNAPSKPALTDDSKKNGRVTIQQPWTFEWTCTPAVSASNSAIQGYRMYLYKWLGNNNTTTINMCDSNGNSLCNLWDGAYYRAQAASSGTSLTFDPKKSGIKPGDELTLRVQGYSFDGNSNRLYSADTYSGYFLVENAGIVRVKHGSNWHEGQVYVKHGGNWHEAQAVYVKSGSNWHESN